MAKDAELDRLKTEQERAYQHKQAAYQSQQSAWEKRCSVRDVMNRVYDTKQRAFEQISCTWQHYQSVRNTNGPRIDSLNTRQEQAYQNMRVSFVNASYAHDRRDGEAARRYANEGRNYKAESQNCVAERGRFIEEIRQARAPHDSAKFAFQQAKADFDAAKRAFEQAKAEHERATATFKQASEALTAANAAFKRRLEYVKAEGQKRRNDKKAIAAKAGVPHQYQDSVWVSTDRDGTTNIYFGGAGKPDGPGHGHYVMDRSGTVTYNRDPFDPHGAHNFKTSQADYFDAVRTESVLGSDEFSFRCTYKGMPALIETGYDNRTGRQKINIYYGAANGMIGWNHGHAVAWRDEPFTIFTDRPPK